MVTQRSNKRCSPFCTKGHSSSTLKAYEWWVCVCDDKSPHTDRTIAQVWREREREPEEPHALMSDSSTHARNDRCGTSHGGMITNFENYSITVGSGGGKKDITTIKRARCRHPPFRWMRSSTMFGCLLVAVLAHLAPMRFAAAQAIPPAWFAVSSPMTLLDGISNLTYAAHVDERIEINLSWRSDTWIGLGVAPQSLMNGPIILCYIPVANVSGGFCRMYLGSGTSLGQYPGDASPSVDVTASAIAENGDRRITCWVASAALGVDVFSGVALRTITAVGAMMNLNTPQQHSQRRSLTLPWGRPRRYTFTQTIPALQYSLTRVVERDERPVAPQLSTASRSLTPTVDDGGSSVPSITAAMIETPAPEETTHPDGSSSSFGEDTTMAPSTTSSIGTNVPTTSTTAGQDASTTPVPTQSTLGPVASTSASPAVVTSPPPTTTRVSNAQNSTTVVVMTTTFPPSTAAATTTTQASTTPTPPSPTWTVTTTFTLALKGNFSAFQTVVATTALGQPQVSAESKLKAAITVDLARALSVPVDQLVVSAVSFSATGMSAEVSFTALSTSVEQTVAVEAVKNQVAALSSGNASWITETKGAVAAVAGDPAAAAALSVGSTTVTSSSAAAKVDNATSTTAAPAAASGPSTAVVFGIAVGGVAMVIFVGIGY